MLSARCATCTTPALAPNSLGPEVRLVGFKRARERGLGGAFLRQADTDTLVDSVDGTHGKVTQLRRVRGGQVHGKQSQKLAELGFTDF